MKRRTFLKYTMAVITGFVLYLWYKMLQMRQMTLTAKKLLLPYDRTKKVAFQGDYIVVNKNGNKPVVFSSHCTHLGCVINKKEGDVLVCPCHGSRFDLNGNPVKGPAYKPLQKVPFEADKDSGNLTVKTT